MLKYTKPQKIKHCSIKFLANQLKFYLFYLLKLDQKWNNNNNNNNKNNNNNNEQ